MPSYKYLRKAELIQLCDDKGINHASCKTKADLIAVIEQYELYNDVITDENLSDDGDNDECVNDTENAVTWSGNNERTNDQYDVEESAIVAGDERTGDDDLVDVCDVPRQGQAEPESVAVLRLRLALAREERMTKEKEWEAKEREWEARVGN